MACRFGLVVALGAALGCTGSSTELSDGGGGAEGTGSGTGSSQGGATGGADDSGGPPGGGGWDTGGGSTGGLEEDDGFGMSDDMPLVADIPDIQQGQVPRGTWVLIEQVPATTGRAILDGREWFYVQDPVAPQYMGLRIALRSQDASPAFDRWLDLVGRVRHDSQGWVLQLETAVEGDLYEGGELLQPIELSALTSATASGYDDALVEITGVGPLAVAQWGLVSGTLVVRDTATGDTALVDLRPFGLEDLPVEPGMRLLRLVGVAEIGSDRPIVLPRSPDDVVIDG